MPSKLLTKLRHLLTLNTAIMRIMLKKLLRLSNIDGALRPFG